MQIAALRGLVTIPLLAVYLWRRDSFHSIVRIKWPLQMVRGVLAIAMLWAFSVGIKSLAMTQAYTIFFIAPMLISILAWPLLGERTSRVRWIALCLGLIGILIALNINTWNNNRIERIQIRIRTLGNKKFTVQEIRDEVCV